jgi:type II secretory pathway component GspD/PulD (secretin)
LTFDTLAHVPETFSATLQALVNERRGQVLANPLVAVINGETAAINVGTQHIFETTTEIYRGVDPPFGDDLSPNLPNGNLPRGGYGGGYGGGYRRQAFNTIETGIRLEITPWIGAAGDITLKLRPEIRDADLLTREQSTIADRSIDTTVRVNDQGMIVIGGLMQEKEIVSESQVPVLGHIPLLGALFSHRNTTKEQTELIVVIQPKLIP